MPAKENAGRLGQKLVAQGLISEEQLQIALREQKRLKTYLGDTLVRLGFITQELLSSALAQEMRTRALDLSNIVVDTEILALVPYEMAKRFSLIPLSRTNDTLSIAIADPFNVVAIDSVQKATGLTLSVNTAPEKAIRDALERQYSHGATIEDTIDELLRHGQQEMDDDASGDPPLIHLVNQIINRAIKERATDIHIAPDENTLRVRMRIDGLLQHEILLPKLLQPAVTARLKIISNMDVTEKRLPQDGRISFQFGLRDIDLRISCMPVIYGENIVIRILDKEALTMELPALGMPRQELDSFTTTLKKKQGLILVTGPTGCGKTTTLYSALHYINDPAHTIYTLEDPVEYRIPMLRQTQIDPKAGLSFATGLRALTRQDPDVILVGEIRDTESAKLAIRAAMTGHLVLSTLHTIDAASTVQRLVDMGVEPYLLVPTLTTVVAQRLVRRLCPECREALPNATEILEDIGIRATPGEAAPQLWRARGCEACAGIGYRGRFAIYELITIDERFHDAIIHGSDRTLIRKLARQQGMRSMREHGIDRALRGDTSLEEVLQATE